MYNIEGGYKMTDKINSPTPLVSIILPIYKVEDYLEECLISIQNQTYDHFEVIAINDASPDRCVEIFENTVGQDSRFKLFSQKNGGISKVRNLGLNLAEGELLTFVDSDDTLEKEYLEELVRGILQYDCDISIVGHSMDFSNFSIPIHFKRPQIMDQKKALSFLVRDMMILNYSWGKCYKKEMWKKISFPLGIIYEDVETLCKVFLNAHSVYVSHQILYHYRIRQGSLTQQKNERNYQLKRAYLNQLRTVYPKYPEFIKYGVFNQIRVDLMIAYDKLMILTNKKK